MGFATYTIHLIKQNRSLQKSMRAKYNQHLEVLGSGDSTVSRLELTKLSREQAHYTRTIMLIKKIIVATALFIPFAFYAFKWISVYLN